jgi:hypothetical protein
MGWSNRRIRAFTFFVVKVMTKAPEKLAPQSFRSSVSVSVVGYA